MTIMGELASLLARGLDIVDEVLGLNESEIIAMGIPDTLAKDVVATAAPFTETNSFQDKRRQTRAAAKKHNLLTLIAVEKQAQRLKKEHQRWDLRLEALKKTGDTKSIDKEARELVKKVVKPRTPKAGVRFAQHSDGNASLTICGPSADLADIRDSIDKDQPIESVLTHWFGEEKAAQPTITLMLVTTMDNYAKACEGHEVWFQLSNGAVISSTELATRNINDYGFHVLLHPVYGPVNLHRISRFASTKQRLMAMGENPVCPWPGCSKGAHDCQVHHLEAWRNGGETSPENLTIACQYHNAVNEVDGRGFLRRRGTIYWVPPKGWYHPPGTPVAPELEGPLPAWVEEEKQLLEEEFMNAR